MPPRWAVRHMVRWRGESYRSGIAPASAPFRRHRSFGFTSLNKVKNISDLARIAGVNPATVSRALSDSPLVNSDTKARIVSLARQYDFRPNQMAQRLRTKKTGVIGIVVPLGHERRQHLSDPFFMTMVAELADAFEESGHDLMLSRIIPDADDWLERIVGSGMLDGVILIGQSDQFAAIERVAEQYRPLVAWGSHWTGQVHCSIGSDNVAGGRLAGDHLIAGGAREIIYLGEVRAPEIAQRYQGLCEATAAAGQSTPRHLDVHLASDAMEQEIARHLDTLSEKVDGIFAASDGIAMQTLRLLADRGFAVPDQIRVVGYDDLPLAIQTVPRLTTIRQDIREGARRMATSLLARIAGEDTASVQMPPTLIVRDSA